MKVVTIGRETSNDIIINDEKVSRHHLQIAQDDNGGFTAVDLGSSNGTFVNGVRITTPVRIRLGDQVRIGSTSLPWQDYFEPMRERMNCPQKRPHPLRASYIAGAVVLLLLVGGGVTWKIMRDKKRDRIEAENVAKAEVVRLQQEVEIEKRDAEAERLQSEADSLFRQALISDNDEARELARKKQQEANDAMEYANRSRDAQLNAERQRDVARASAQAAETREAQAREDAQNARNRAAEEARNAREAEENLRIAQRERDLTNAFFRLDLGTLKPNSIQMVYDKMKWTLPQDRDQRVNYIKTQFERADNNQKDKIIEAIQAALTEQSRERVLPNTDSISLSPDGSGTE